MYKFYYIFNSYFTFKPYYKWITFNTLKANAKTIKLVKEF